MASSLKTINDGSPGSLFFISDMILQHSTLSSVLRLNNVVSMYVPYGCMPRSSVTILCPAGGGGGGGGGSCGL